ncbi:MAG: hydrogenase expression protein HyaE [Sutterella sp.]|nr:hydrogenase expression protein HyaE [Sutterella sp.]
MEGVRKPLMADQAGHPAFARLFGAEGFRLLKEEDLGLLTKAEGMQLAVFADDPNRMKETIDIAVIAPEIRRALGSAVAGAWFSETARGRAMAARYGIRRLPAVALFRSGVYLGAAEGLMNWDAYLKQLADIGMRRCAPKKTIAVLNG